MRTANQNHFLLFTPDQSARDRLSALLAAHGRLVSVNPQHGLDEMLHKQGAPRVIFIDFKKNPSTGSGTLPVEAARQLCAHAAQRLPQVPRVALIRYDEGSTTVEALRAGASDCIDLRDEDDAQKTIQRLMSSPMEKPIAQPSGCSILIMGARPGMGATTLATHLANAAQVRLQTSPTSGPQRTADTTDFTVTEARVCLLDLGMPARDGLLYLGVTDGFNLLDAVRSLNRLDRTLLDSALLRNGQGLSVLGFPIKLDELRQVDPTDVLTLFTRLRDYFDLTVIDAGGMGNPSFEAGLAKAAAHTWIVSDQSLGGLLSLTNHLEMMSADRIDPGTLRLVINEYDERLGLTAQQISDRFGVPLLGTLPESRRFLWQHTGKSEGTRSRSRNPYMRAVEHLLDQALEESACKRRPTRMRDLWNALIPGRHINQHSGGNS